MNALVQAAVDAVLKSKTAFCKFISANDGGETGAHQSGLYIPKNSIALMFDSPGVKGSNKDRFVTIDWQAGELQTDSRFIYYGKESRNEYRLTRFGRGFPYLNPERVGDLFVLAHIEKNFYEGFVLSTEEDIEDFLSAFNLSPNDTNCLIDRSGTQTAEASLLACFNAFLKSVKAGFPSTELLAASARNCYNAAHLLNIERIKKDPDAALLNWVEAEYSLFKLIESDRYKSRISSPFKSVEELIETANTILNRRKSRAGKSLEHHLSEVFNSHGLKYQNNPKTEGNKKPDFIFPGGDAYHSKTFDGGKLIFLASKTTCKDRWRQILNEADRIPIKHLFTLQQGISKNQLDEMYKANVRLVVPDVYIKKCYPKEYHGKILALRTFIDYTRQSQL